MENIAMTKLKLGLLKTDRPVKLTIELPADVYCERGFVDKA